MTRFQVRNIIVRALFDMEHSENPTNIGVTQLIFGRPRITYDEALDGIANGTIRHEILTLYVDKAEAVVRKLEEANVVDFAP